MNEQGPEKGRIIKLFKDKEFQGENPNISKDESPYKDLTPEEIKNQLELFEKLLEEHKNNPDKLMGIVTSITALKEKLGKDA